MPVAGPEDTLHYPNGSTSRIALVSDSMQQQKQLQRKEAKKGLGWEKCSLHCKKMSPTQMGSYAHLLIYTSTLISMKGFQQLHYD